MVRGALVYSGTSAYALDLINKDVKDGRYVELSADHAQGYNRVRGKPFRIAELEAEAERLLAGGGAAQEQVTAAARPPGPATTAGAGIPTGDGA